MNFILIISILDILIASGLLIIKLGRLNYNKEKYEGGDYFNPKALIILPIKGKDFQMNLNLRSLKQQTYSNFRIIAVIDDENDESVDVLKEEGIEYLISDALCSECSGKVRAIYSALLRFRDFHCYVIADSDIRVERDWLGKLIKPLSKKDVGISTTFPKFYPEGGFWSYFKMYWGMIGESMMESSITRFAWGGSLAFRNDLLDDNDLKEFSSSISDDISLLNICKRKGLKVAYVKDATVLIHSPDNFRIFLEWSNRQTALSISSSNKIFLLGMIYYVLASFLIISVILMSILGYYLFLLLLIPVFYISYSNYRNAPVKNGLFIAHNFILYFFYIYNLMAGKFKKNITWRGRNYQLKSKV
ncbi:MAG: glycosyltransferase [Thermoplasmata archaeon]